MGAFALSHWLQVIVDSGFHSARPQSHSPSVVRNSQPIITSFCCEGTHMHVFRILVGFHFAYLLYISPVAGRKAPFDLSLPHAPFPLLFAHAPAVMPNPEIKTITLKFEYPPVRYHQDIRTVTILKYDSGTDEPSELYRVCGPFIACGSSLKEVLCDYSSNTLQAGWPSG